MVGLQGNNSGWNRDSNDTDGYGQEARFSDGGPGTPGGARAPPGGEETGGAARAPPLFSCLIIELVAGLPIAELELRLQLANRASAVG
ncbi:MAG: hypothetical protein AB1486_34560 [Planctomycetota bacterium]